MLSLLVHLLRFMVAFMSAAVSVTVGTTVVVAVRACAMGMGSRGASNEGRLSKIAALLRAEILDSNKVSTTETTNNLHRDACKRECLYARSEYLWKKRKCASSSCARGISTVCGVSLPEWERHYSRMNVLCHIRWNVNLSIVRSKNDCVALLHADLLGGVRM
jgi:hypothetical protein